MSGNLVHLKISFTALTELPASRIYSLEGLPFHQVGITQDTLLVIVPSGNKGMCIVDFSGTKVHPATIYVTRS